MDSNTRLIAISIIVGALALLLVSVFTKTLIPVGIGRKGKRTPTFIIAGPNGAGKTSLWAYLISGKFQNTVMSQEPNQTINFKLPLDHDTSDEDINEKQSQFTLVDYPGHPKLRHLLYSSIDENKTIPGLIYVIDSSATDSKNITSNANFLLEILKRTEKRPGGVDILIACNKSESFSSRPPFKIKELLQKEINELITIKSKGLNEVSLNDKGQEEEIDDDDEFLTGREFRFEDLEGNVDFIAGSLIKGKIDKWDCWLNERAFNPT